MSVSDAPQAAAEGSVTVAPPTRPATPTAASPFERLLVPVDFSSASRAAFALAMRLADWSGSEVWLFNAAGFDDNDEFLDHTGVPWGRSDVVEEVRAHLQDFAEAVVPGSGKRVRIEAVRSEKIVQAVTAACRRHASTMIILGVHPHDKRRLLRSVTERIVHSVDCPAILVRGEPEAVVDADM